MGLSSISPSLLVFVAAVLLAWASYNYQTRQSRNSTAMRDQIDSAVNLMQQMATQTGNKDLLKESIDTRTRVMSTERRKDDQAIEEILPGSEIGLIIAMLNVLVFTAMLVTREPA